MAEVKTAGIGGEVATKRSFFGRSWEVLYAGMPGERTFSLCVSWAAGYRQAAYNLFFPLEEREVSLPFGKLYVEGVAPQGMRFRLEMPYQ